MKMIPDVVFEAGEWILDMCQELLDMIGELFGFDTSKKDP